MKRGKYVAAVLIALGIYVAGLVLGTVLICLLPQYLERRNTNLYVNEKVIEYRTTGRVSNWSNNGVAVIIYKEDGALYRFFGQGSTMFRMDFYYQTYQKINRVIAGERTYDFYALVRDYSSLGYCSRLYAGRRIEIDDQYFAFFWVKEISDLPEILFGFILAFTIISAFTFVIVLVSLKRQDRYAMLQKRYIDNITHELKTPVASVKAITEALSDGLASDEVQRNAYYGMILSETNQQQKMIQEALLLSRLQSGIDRVALSRVAPEAVFAAIAEKYELLFDLAGLGFQIHESVYELPQLYANETNLIKVISTLLDNAIKYVPEGGRVMITGSVISKKAIICIRDNGEGISAEDLPYIFERFYRSGRDDEKAGSGLGLAIAKELVVAMKGEIWAESEKGKGTRMYIRLRTG